MAAPRLEELGDGLAEAAVGKVGRPGYHRLTGARYLMLALRARLHRRRLFSIAHSTA
jgi:hypothetical protein